ncbi:MAG: aminomethyl transferase family protein [Desulfobulbaceae bacterium]|nr:MAG: aminomethyl transferase family protein [Desulfobulbaceae bacterium]
MEELRTTPLHRWHLDQGANMAHFGLYDMPLWYPAGAKAEHLAVIEAAGIFDTSHMALIGLRGKGALALLQRCFSKDLEHCQGKDRGPLTAGRCVYGVFLAEDGTVIDDAIVYRLGEDSWMVVVNAGMGGIVARHLEDRPEASGVQTIDYTDRIGKMDIQGPLAAKVLGRVLRDPQTVFAGMTYFSCKGGFGELIAPHPVTLLDGTPLLLSRTGYTGEFGFELFAAGDRIVSLWQTVLAAGEEFAVLPCGLAARDSLRTGAVLPLSHQDIGPWKFANNPWLFALPWDDGGKSFSKDFIGGRSLLDDPAGEYTLPFAGFDPRKITVGKDTFVTNLQGDTIGQVLTCATDMAIGRVGETIISVATPAAEGRPEEFRPRGLSCGFVKVHGPLAAGDIVIITDGRRDIRVEIRADIRPHRSARRPITSML